MMSSTTAVRIVLATAMLLMVLCCTAMAEGTVPGVHVLADSREATVLEISLPEWTTRTSEHGSLHLPLHGAAGVDSRAGARMTPYLSRMVAVAGDRPPRIVIEDQRWGEWRPGLAPFGTVEDVNNLPVATLQGRGPVVVEEPWEWRHRMVSRLFVVPVREENGGVVPLTYLRLRIEHDPATAIASARPDELVAGGVTNPTAARNYAIARSDAGKRGGRIAANWPTNPMVRIEIEQEGIYQLTASSLASRGIDVSGYDPRRFRLYNNGGQPLPKLPGSARPDSLIENAILVEGGEDGSFTGSDRILFYGRAVNSWEAGALPGSYVHTNNPYTTRNVYWLELATDGPEGKRMESFEPEGSVQFETSIGRSRLFIDNDAVIFHSNSHPESGLNWYATELLAGEMYSASFELPAVLPDADGSVTMSYKNLGGYNNRATVSINGTQLDEITLQNTNQTLEIPANLLRQGSNTFSFRLIGGRVFFNWVEIDYLRTLTTLTGRISFDALGTAQLAQDGIAEVTLDGLDNPHVFEVQDWDDVRYVRGSTFTTQVAVNTPRRRIAVDDDALLSPPTVALEGHGGPEYPNGLRDPSLAAETIFIYHEDFTSATGQLESYVEQRDGIEVLAVDIADIFREFGWGLPDPVAIRDYLKYTYDHYAVTPESVLLIGDGDYDYRNIVSNADKNWIPPYEDGVVCRDYWFTEFSNGAVTEIQMVIGRLPMQSNGELATFLEKLIAYETESDLGPWRSRLIMVADDEYVENGPTIQDAIHMEQAEEFSEAAAPDFLTVNKLYIGTYPTTYDPVTGGRRKPDATRALLNEINRGALMVSFIGHGNAHVWTHESVMLDSRDNQLIDSGDRTPFYIAATCSWGHYDRPQNESHPELLLRRRGGAIGVVAATRLTNAYSNNRFALAFYERVFDRAAEYSTGRALFYAMLEHPEGTNQYYHLLGEPNMRLALPSLDVSLMNVAPDSLTALGEASVEGAVRTPDGTPLLDFEGESLVTVYDSADTLTYKFVNNSGEVYDSLRYQVSGGTLFRGLVSTTGGELTANFIVPRDVKYGSENGSVHMYAFNEAADGVGAAGGVKISTRSADRDDSTPPDVTVYFDRDTWRDGDLTTASPTLFVRLADSSGINLTGEIGHDIRAVLNGDEEILLTETFTYDRDSYVAGVAEERLFSLEPGRHELEVWAWDNANNFARETVEFVVIDADQELALQNVLNWPNPFEDRTNFTFELSTDAEVTIDIYTASGRRIKSIGPVAGRAGFNYPEGTSFELEWDGRDDSGDPVANGAYLYVIKAKGAQGQNVEQTGKLLRIR